MQETMGIKAVLPSSGKVVILRPYKIKHRELGIRAVGTKAGESHFLFGELLQKEMIKILVSEVEGKKVSAIDMEDLDSHFTPVEFAELGKVVGKVMGADAIVGEPQIEFVGTGA